MHFMDMVFFYHQKQIPICFNGRRLKVSSGLKKFSLFFALILLISLLATITLSCSGQGDANIPAESGKINMPIVLLTDFGSEDYRVSQVKGILHNQNPVSKVIDASHSVPAFNVNTGAFILDIAAKEFPEDVVFVAIIDPYSQPEIKYLVLTTDKNQHFVLPDNGLLTYITKNTGIKSIYQITNGELFDKPLNELPAERIQSVTGALIASGYNPGDVGSPLDNPYIMDIQEPVIMEDRLLGTVIYIDHFGNCITNISEETVGEFAVNPEDKIWVKSPHSEVPSTFGTIYSDVPQQEEIVFVNNNLGMLQLSVNLGSFAERHTIEAGTKIEIVK